MSVKKENSLPEDERHVIKDSITGLGQKIIGEIETLAGVINADPLAQAEGEFNVEVGDLREEIEDYLLEKDNNRRDAETQS
ncbi:MAG: hypothetical protein ACRD6X_08605 [Pyrinomonadaceae bacterium]